MLINTVQVQAFFLRFAAILWGAFSLSTFLYHKYKLVFLFICFGFGGFFSFPFPLSEETPLQSLRFLLWDLILSSHQHQTTPRAIKK